MTVRVLHVLEALEGGTARHLRDVVRFTPGVEHHVAVPARRVGGLTDTDAIPAMRAAGAVVHVVAMTRRPPSARNALALAHLSRIVRGVDIDVVHAHSSVGGALGRVAAAVTRRPAVYTPNGLYDSAAALTLERLLGHLTARLVAVSASEAERVRELRLVPDHRLVVIPNGIDLAPPTTPFDLRPLAAIPPEAPVVAFVGRLIAQKQPLVVVDALHRVLDARPDAYALLVGDGPLRSEVEAAIGGHPRMRRLDGVRAVSAGLGSADVVVLLSSFEGAPYIPLEAMLAGTPVVVSDVVGSRDAVSLAGGGLIVADRDPAAAAAAVLRLLADDAQRARLGAAGAAGVRRELGADRMGRALAETYAAVQRSGVRRSAYSNRPDHHERG